MIFNIKKKIQQFLIFRKVVNLNKKIFKKKDNSNKKIFLIEFNAFHNYHITYAIFSNFIRKKENCEIHAFFNYSLLSSSLKFNFLNELKWNFGNFFSFKTFNIYKSFGVDKIFKPKIDKSIDDISYKYFEKIFLSLNSKDEILNIKIKDILIGDLLYDTYLKSNLKPTIDIKSKNFERFSLNFFKLFFYWYNYLKTNDVNGVLASHGVYSYGLILRIAEAKKIPCYLIDTKYLSKFRSVDYGGSMFGDYKNYKKNFNKVDFDIKKKGLKKAEEILNKKFKGSVGSKVYMEYADVSSFSQEKREIRFLEKNDKFKVLISTHDFFDAVHFYGKFFYNDFYEWLINLSNIAKQTNYDWYIKCHPLYGGRYKIYQKFSNNIVNDFIKENNHIKLLPNNASNKQLIEEGINTVLTVYGTVASEFPFFGVPVINACNNNPHSSYDFSISPKTKEDYENLLKKLPQIKVSEKSNEQIIEYFFMRHILIDKNWLFDDYDLMIEEIGGYHNLQSYRFYEFWIKYCEKQKIQRAEENIRKFLNGDDLIFQIEK